MIHMMALLAAMDGGTGFPTMSNVVVSSSDTPGPVTAGYRFDVDGGSSRNNLGSYADHNPGEWYSREPSPSIGISYEIRCASLASGTWTTEAAAIGTWVALSSAREWLNTKTSGSGSKQTVGNMEIGIAGTSTALVSFTLDITATIL